MKRPELLGVMLKAIGFWSLVGGLSGLPRAVSFSHQYPDEQAFLLTMADTFAGPSILIIASWFLIRTTNWFIQIADPNTSIPANNSDESSRDLLGILLKALGYWGILNGVVRVPYESAQIYRASFRTVDGIAYIGIAIVTGCFLVFATEWCVQFAYRESARVSDDEADADIPN